MSGLFALWRGLFPPPPPLPPFVLAALVVGDPVRRGPLWRAPVVHQMLDGTDVTTGWGGWSRDPTRAEVRALRTIQRIRRRDAKRWRQTD